MAATCSFTLTTTRRCGRRQTRRHLQRVLVCSKSLGRLAPRPVPASQLRATEDIVPTLPWHRSSNAADGGLQREQGRANHACRQCRRNLTAWSRGSAYGAALWPPRFTIARSPRCHQRNRQVWSTHRTLHSRRGTSRIALRPRRTGGSEGCSAGWIAGSHGGGAAGALREFYTGRCIDRSALSDDRDDHYRDPGY